MTENKLTMQDIIQLAWAKASDLEEEMVTFGTDHIDEDMMKIIKKFGNEPEDAIAEVNAALHKMARPSIYEMKGIALDADGNERPVEGLFTVTNAQKAIIEFDSHIREEGMNLIRLIDLPEKVQAELEENMAWRTGEDSDLMLAPVPGAAVYIKAANQDVKITLHDEGRALFVDVFPTNSFDKTPIGSIEVDLESHNYVEPISGLEP